MTDTPRHAHTDTDSDRLRWQEWVDRACAAVGADASQVDVPALHDLSKQVARRLERPLVPVSAFILGLTLGAAGARGDVSEDSRAAALACILGTLPGEPG